MLQIAGGILLALLIIGLIPLVLWLVIGLAAVVLVRMITFCQWARDKFRKLEDFVDRL